MVALQNSSTGVPTLLCEVRMDGKVGHGLADMVFMGAYPRYGYTGW